MITTSNLRLKVCGMRDHDNIMAVGRLHPDMMGFIFYPGSKRYVGDDFEIPSGLDATIGRVGVFVNQPITEVIATAKRHQLNYVQFHGSETAAECNTLKHKGYRVIKAFGIDETFSFEETRAYEDAVDLFLFDTKTALFGGSGTNFNWELLRAHNQHKPFLLSGGIGPEQSGQVLALEDLNIFGLDVNSGVESFPGMKDIGKVKEVIVKIKG